MSDISTLAPTPPTTRPRDGFLDLLRSLSIVRVVVIHVLNKARFWFWPAPTYVMPGMPIVFFVSGGLAYQSLRLRDGVRRASTDYWRRTYRRLFLPYWAYYGVMAVIAVAADVASDSPKWTVSYRSLLIGATGLVVPTPSPGIRLYTGHLWFMSVFLVLAFLAPGLVRAFERARWVTFGVLVAVCAFVQLLEVGFGVRIVDELESVATFTVPYVAGFWYTDGGLTRAPAKWLAAAGLTLGMVAALYDDLEGGTVNASHGMHLIVGMAWLLGLLALAPLLRRLATRWASLIARITPRTLTTYLWGWTTCLAAAEVAREWIGSGTSWDYRVVMAVLSFVFLGAAIIVFGRIEDLAAGRKPGGSRRNS